jgi:rod shape-determining protein MreD
LPDLCLILVVYFAIADGEERAMFTGVVGGIYQDVASNTVLGHHVLCLVCVGYAVGRIATRLVTEHPAVKAGLVFVAGLTHGALFQSVLYIQNPDNGFIYPLATLTAPAAFYTALLTPFVFFMVNWILRRPLLMPKGA